MRILITVPTFPPFNSGLGNAAAAQARVLAAHGAEVIVCTGGEARSSAYSADGYAVERFAVTGADWLASPIRGDVTGYLDFISHAHADLLLLNAWQTWSTDIVLQNLSCIPGRKAVYSHGLATDILLRPQPVRSAMRYLLWRPYRWRLARRLRSVDALIALAPSGCDARFDDVQLAKRLGVPVHVVPNMLPEYAVRTHELTADITRRRTLIAVGAYEAAKGHDFVLRTYAASKAKNLIPLRFFGQRETNLISSLRHLAGALGIDDGMINFHAGINGQALFEEYQQAIAFLSGSHTECQPLVLLDALASGTPFVARATGCIPDLAGGIAVRTVDEAVAALDSLLDNDRWRSLSKIGRQTAREHHWPDQVAMALWSTARRIVSGEHGQ